MERGGEKVFIQTSEVCIDDKVLTKIPVVIRAQGGLSIHEAELRMNKNGIMYYMFYYIYGTYVTNYCKNEFVELNKVIPIEKESIFLYADGQIIPVPESYRNA